MHLQQTKWAEGNGARHIPHHADVAALLNRLLKRNPPPTDPTQPLPTPPAAVWETMHIQVQTLLQVRDFFSGMSYQSPRLKGKVPAADNWQSLLQDLSELPYNVIAGYLPDLSLDVSALMR